MIRYIGCLTALYSLNISFLLYACSPDTNSAQQEQNLAGQQDSEAGEEANQESGTAYQQAGVEAGLNGGNQAGSLAGISMMAGTQAGVNAGTEAATQAGTNAGNTQVMDEDAPVLCGIILLKIERLVRADFLNTSTVY